MMILVSTTMAGQFLYPLRPFLPPFADLSLIAYGINAFPLQDADCLFPTFRQGIAESGERFRSNDVCLRCFCHRANNTRGENAWQEQVEILIQNSSVRPMRAGPDEPKTAKTEVL